jgi:hypothetical protein
VVANQSSMFVREGNTVRNVPASLAVFRIQGNGKLEYLSKRDVDVDANRLLFWMTLVRLP